MSHSYARQLKMTCLECGEELFGGCLHDRGRRRAARSAGNDPQRDITPGPLLVLRPPRTSRGSLADLPPQPGTPPAVCACSGHGRGMESRAGQGVTSGGSGNRLEGAGGTNGSGTTCNQFQNRSMLPAALSDDPEAAMQETAKQQARNAERMKAEHPERYYDALLNAFVGAQAEARKREIVQSYPDLLSKEARTRLNARMAKALEDRKMDSGGALLAESASIGYVGGRIQTRLKSSHPAGTVPKMLVHAIGRSISAHLPYVPRAPHRGNSAFSPPSVSRCYGEIAKLVVQYQLKLNLTH